MTQSEFIRRLVLNAICDDFENVDQVILPEVARVGAKCGLAIPGSDVLEALRALVETGLAKAYELSAADRDPFSGEIQGMPSLAVPEEDLPQHCGRLEGRTIRTHRITPRNGWTPRSSPADFLRDGKYHRIAVKVNRAGLHVYSQRGY
jgi:hypothetical protein